MPSELRDTIREAIRREWREGKGKPSATVKRINHMFSCDEHTVALSSEVVRTSWRGLRERRGQPSSLGGATDREQIITNLRARESTLQKQVKALQEDRTAIQTVREAVREVASAFPPVPPVFVPRAGDSPHVEEAVLQLSCWHYGEVVSEEETAGFGSYNIAMAQARAQYLTECVIDLAVDHHKGEHIRKLWVVDLGDNISGNIHEELRVTNERPIIPQTLGVSLLLALSLRDLAGAFDEVELIGLPGNHPRTQQKPVHKQKASDSFDRMVYETVGLLTSEIKNIKVTIPGSFFYRVAINDWYFLFMHGDNIRSWMNLPMYGMYRADANMTKLYASKELFYRYLGLGHFHVGGNLPSVGGEILMTGSLKGSDEFSIDALHTGADPRQLFYGVHHKRGVSFRYPVSVAEADPAIHSRYQFDLPNVTLLDTARKLGLL